MVIYLWEVMNDLGFSFRIGPERQCAQSQEKCHFYPALSLKRLKQSHVKKEYEHRETHDLYFPISLTISVRPHTDQFLSIILFENL